MKVKGETFKAIREDNMISQSQIAKYLDVEQSVISKFEKNELLLSVDLLEKSADLFGCSVRVFFEEDVAKSEMNTVFHKADSTMFELEDLAMINRIALNLMKMEELESTYVK